MTRRQSLSADQVKLAKSLHVPGRIGYETIGKRMGIPASTVRDCVLNRSAYAARAK